MSRIRGPRDKKYGQKNIDEDGINPKSPKAKLEEIKALRAANKITSKIEKPKKTTSSINPRSPRARLEARKSLKKANEITSKPAKGKKTFEFKGKKYARVTADEVKKAGFASLKDYLNAPRKTQIAKK